MSERLEEIKKQIKLLRGDMSVTSIEVDVDADIILDDMEWLIEQAERVEWLVENRKVLEDELHEARETGARIYEQNERCRDHLQYMLDEAKDHKDKGFRIQHWALIRDLEIALESESSE